MAMVTVAAVLPEAAAMGVILLRITAVTMVVMTAEAITAARVAQVLVVAAAVVGAISLLH
jgi:hypothetical protein